MSLIEQEPSVWAEPGPTDTNLYQGPSRVEIDQIQGHEYEVEGVRVIRGVVGLADSKPGAIPTPERPKTEYSGVIPGTDISVTRK